MTSVANLVGVLTFLDLKKKGLKTDQALRPAIFAGIAPAGAEFTGTALAIGSRRRLLRNASAQKIVAQPVTLAASTSPPAPSNEDAITALKAAVEALGNDVKDLQGYVRKNCKPPRAK